MNMKLIPFATVKPAFSHLQSAATRSLYGDHGRMPIWYYHRYVQECLTNMLYIFSLTPFCTTCAVLSWIQFLYNLAFSNSASAFFLYNATTTAPPSPKLCWRATFAPGTCRGPHSPRSCRHSSVHCARPEMSDKIKTDKSLVRYVVTKQLRIQMWSPDELTPTPVKNQ